MLKCGKKIYLVLSTVFLLAGCSNKEEALCLDQIRKTLINPETLQSMDFNPSPIQQLTGFYDNAKSELSAALTMNKIDCIEQLSLKCVNSRWGNYALEQKEIVDAFESINKSSDFKGFKLRIKAAAKGGNTVTAFYFCAMGSGKVFAFKAPE